MISFGGFLPRLEKIISRADSWSAGESARGIARGLKAELFGGIGVE